MALAAILFLAAPASRMLGYALKARGLAGQFEVNVRLAHWSAEEGCGQLREFQCRRRRCSQPLESAMELTKLSWATSFGAGINVMVNTAFFLIGLWQTFGEPSP